MSEFLVNVADLRTGVYCVASASSMERRVSGFCDALAAWCRLPNVAREFYGRTVLDCLFKLAEDIEEDPVLGDHQRLAIELSFWQAICDLRLQNLDHGHAEFITRRQVRLHKMLESSATGLVLKLLYNWAALLRPRAERIQQLPGPYQKEAANVVTELLNAGLPRRARALALKFQLGVDPLVRLAIKHKSEEEEFARTKSVLERLASPPQPIPYRVFVCGRALGRVLSAPLDALPLSVGSRGISF